MKPEPLPILKGECAKRFVEQVEKPLTAKELVTFRKASEVYKSIKHAK